ncbi:hypothetical protein JCM10449v2_002815 [Rhodotorula kratochvilovae]
MLPSHGGLAGQPQLPSPGGPPPPQPPPGIAYAQQHSPHQQHQQRQAPLRQFAPGQQLGQLPPQGPVQHLARTQPGPGAPPPQGQGQRGGAGMNGVGVQGGTMLPPPGMQRVGAPPPPGQVIGPSHPSHPQHGAWLAHQQHLQQQQQQQQQALPQPCASSSANSVPSSPLNHALPYPPQPGAPPPGSVPHQHRQLPPPPRSLPPTAGMRPPSALGAHAPQPGGAPPYGSPIQQPLPAPPPPRQGMNGMHPQAGMQQQLQGGGMPPRQMVRPSIAPQPNTLLAAHLALNGTGPITATAAPTGPALARLSALNDAIMLALEKESPLDALRTVIAEHFTETGVIKIGLFDKSTQMSKVFEIPCSAFPRFQHLNLLLGVLSTVLTVHFVREFRLTTPDPSLPSSPSSPPTPQVHIGYLLRAEDASWTSRFAHGARVDLLGALTMHLMFKDLGGGSAGLRIESLEFDAKTFEESVARGAMEPVALPPSVPAASKEADEDAARASKARKASTASKRGMVTRRRSASAKVEQEVEHEDDDDRDAGDAEREDKKPSPQREASREDGEEKKGAVVRVPASAVGGFGITELGMRCLEIAESVAQLQELIALSIETGVGPVECLSTYGSRPAPPPPQHFAPQQHPSQQQHPPPPPQQHQPYPHQQPPTPGGGGGGAPPVGVAVAAAQQNPSTNSFYSSVTASPGGRPPSAGAAGASGAQDAGSPGGVGAAGKRKADAGAGAGQAQEGEGGEPGSPQKVARGAGSARGRGRGR